jgi:hypothetical protein
VAALKPYSAVWVTPAARQVRAGNNNVPFWGGPRPHKWGPTHNIGKQVGNKDSGGDTGHSFGHRGAWESAAMGTKLTAPSLNGAFIYIVLTTTIRAYNRLKVMDSSK